MMLEAICTGSELSRFVVIEDNIKISARALLWCFVARLCERLDEVHVFCYDTRPEDVPSSIPAAFTNRIVIHDGHTDLYGWLDSGQLTAYTDCSSYLQEWTASRRQHTTNVSSIAVVFDSISPCFLDTPPADVCQKLHRLTNVQLSGIPVQQIVCLLHSDLHDDATLRLIRHISTTDIQLLPVTSPDKYAVSQTVHKRSSGKVLKTSEYFSITSSYQLMNVSEIVTDSSTDKELTSKTKEPMNPGANLTFNLSLSKQEESAREQLILPYIHTGSKPKSGEIIYEPDEADDFDDEDPDDDLDI